MYHSGAPETTPIFSYQCCVLPSGAHETVLGFSCQCCILPSGGPETTPQSLVIGSVLCLCRSPGTPLSLKSCIFIHKLRVHLSVLNSRQQNDVFVCGVSETYMYPYSYFSCNWCNLFSIALHTLLTQSLIDSGVWFFCRFCLSFAMALSVVF